MSEALDLAGVAALVGDAARANILAALLNGQALTASELAYFAHVSPQTASAHLGKLTEGCLITMMRQGRNRYYRLATPAVVQMLERILAVAADGPRRHRPPTKCDTAMREARTCYDHFAGRLGVALADSLAARGHVFLTEEGGEVTDSGATFLTEFGIDLGAAHQRRRTFCRPCLDWTERRLHIGGAVGAALATRCFDLGWFTRLRDCRAVNITTAGRRGLSEAFGVTLDGQPATALKQVS
jgi:DNA-binding transcriptional ArsR family regulator